LMDALWIASTGHSVSLPWRRDGYGVAVAC
jgi:hypothetical protein